MKICDCFDLWKIKVKSRALSKDIEENLSKDVEDKIIRLAKKHVCGNCCMKCKQIDLLCGCVRYYTIAFKDGYKTGYSDGYEVGKKNERELQCGKKRLEKLAKENEALKQQVKKVEIVDGEDTDLHIDKPVYAIHLANIKGV